MLTAAVRDLHHTYPGRFLTDVRTSCPALWENNPFITPLAECDPEVEWVRCEYPLIHKSNTHPYHFIHGFIEFLGDHLGLRIQPGPFKGDLYLSDLERSWVSQVAEITGDDTPFWIVVSGGKYDFTTKWWDPKRYQAVVDRFKDRIRFVQIGEQDHHHPPLRGVIDLRGKTDLRQLVRLVYHAQGVLTPVSLPMHLAAALPAKEGAPQNRPCVVVAGGREPSHWEAYTHHQFIHTNGALPCCDNGGCWKSRVKPLGDGSKADRPENLCLDVAGDLPRCMDMIPAEEVVRRIELYYTGGSLRFLKEGRYTCPFCHRSCDDLVPIGVDAPVLKTREVIGGGRRPGGCPYCRSSDRERLVYLFLKEKLNIFGSGKINAILHIAPERNLSKALLNFGFDEYVCGDLLPERYPFPAPVLPMDLLDIPYRSSVFDLVICNHVLEHIPDDLGAMRELRRVMKPGGKAILQVPLARRAAQTLEDPSVTDPAERERVFGQSDHVRIYGQDYPKRLEKAGFKVRRVNVSGDFSQYGVNVEEDIFLCRK